MIGRFNNNFLYWYPRMNEESAILWREFLKEHRHEFDSFDYDLKVGHGLDPGEYFEPVLRKDFIELTKKRIDVVGYKDNLVTLFEIKPRAGLSAVGQLIGYKQLFQLTFLGTKVNRLVLITGMLNEDEKLIYNSNGIDFFVYQFT